MKKSLMLRNTKGKYPIKKLRNFSKKVAKPVKLIQLVSDIIYLQVKTIDLMAGEILGKQISNWEGIKRPPLIQTGLT